MSGPLPACIAAESTVLYSVGLNVWNWIETPGFCASNFLIMPS